MTELVDVRGMTDAEYAAARRAVIHKGLVEARALAAAAEMDHIAKRYLTVENKS